MRAAALDPGVAASRQSAADVRKTAGMPLPRRRSEQSQGTTRTRKNRELPSGELVQLVINPCDAS